MNDERFSWGHVGEQRWFCRSDKEWDTIAERLKQTACPHCKAVGNPRNNLAHCFTCKKNLNNIDLLMTLDYDFRDAVALLERLLNEYQARQGKSPANP